MSDKYRINDWKNLGIFNKDENFSYVLKKTERIVSAIYIVTNLIKDNESIKKDIRDESMVFFSLAFSLNGIDESGRSNILHNFFESGFELTSLMSIASSSDIISKMNAHVLISEISSLVQFVKRVSSQSIEDAGYILSDTFFATDVPQQTQMTHTNQVKSKEEKVKNIKDIKDIKSNRQESIINLLKKDSNLTIKDFLKVITDCSEKTIQRELMALVEKGVIKKEGERRWSRYSLI